jgi:hypothetical protein
MIHQELVPELYSIHFIHLVPESNLERKSLNSDPL